MNNEGMVKKGGARHNPKLNNIKKGTKARWKEERREEHEARKAAHDKLTTKQKIVKLDNKLGKGVGAKKERARLAASV